MSQIVLYPGQDENGRFYQSEDGSLFCVIHTGIVSYNERLMGEATFEDGSHEAGIQNVLHGTGIKVNVSNEKQWVDGVLDIPKKTTLAQLVDTVLAKWENMGVEIKSNSQLKEYTLAALYYLYHSKDWISDNELVRELEGVFLGKLTARDGVMGSNVFMGLVKQRIASDPRITAAPLYGIYNDSPQNENTFRFGCDMDGNMAIEPFLMPVPFEDDMFIEENLFVPDPLDFKPYQNSSGECENISIQIKTPDGAVLTEIDATQWFANALGPVVLKVVRRHLYKTSLFDEGLIDSSRKGEWDDKFPLYLVNEIARTNPEVQWLLHGLNVGETFHYFAFNGEELIKWLSCNRRDVFDSLYKGGELWPSDEGAAISLRLRFFGL